MRQPPISRIWQAESVGISGMAVTNAARTITILTAVAAFIAGFLSIAHTAAAGPVVGKPAPAFAGTDSNGNTVSLEQFGGKTVVLEWTNHDCPFVRKHYGSGNMQALQKEATSDDVVWLSVISSAPGRQGHVSPEQANALTVDRKAAPSAVILDLEGVIGRAYEATATPHMFVIDSRGVLVYKGAIDDRPSANPADVKIATNYVRDALAATAAGRKPKPGATRAYGCSVKYGF